MNAKIKYWLRWIAVLPGAIIIGFLSTFPVHWILYLAFARDGTLLGFIELPPGINIPIENFIYPSIVAFTFVFAGYKIAPKYKFKTAIVLFGIYIITWSIVSFVALSNGSIHNLDIQFLGRTILAIVGASIGLFTARNETKKVN